MNNDNNIPEGYDVYYYELEGPQQQSVANQVQGYKKRDEYSLRHGGDHSNKRNLGKGLGSSLTNNPSSANRKINNPGESSINSTRFIPSNKPNFNQSHFNNLSVSNQSGNKNDIATAGASMALTSAGVPKPLADKIANSKAGQKAINNYMKTKHPFLSAASKILGARKKKTEETTATEGFINAELSMTEIIVVATVCGAIALVACVVCFFSASQTYLNAKKLHQGYSSDQLDNFITNKMTDEQKDEEVDGSQAQEDIRNDNGYIDYTDSKYIPVGRTVKKFKKDDLRDLDDFYSAASIYAIDNDTEVVYNFFFKMDFIRKHYIKNYGIEPDIPLLMSTLIMESDEMGIVFKNNTIGFDYSKCRTGLFGKYNYDKCIDNEDYDYDHDWSNYKIQEGNSEHDMEILVQHMITAEAEESCTNKDGEVTKTNKLENEDVLKKVLECEKDEEYSVTKPKYEIDDDRYYEFLQEFIEKKYMINTISGNNNSQSSYNGDFFVQTDPQWTGVYMGNSKYSVQGYGCFMTSLTNQIVRSGTYIKPDCRPLDLKVAAKKLDFNNGGLIWQSSTNIAPNFVFKERKYTSSKSEIINILKNMGDNCYAIIGVDIKSRGTTHYVAVDYVDYSTQTIYIMDPSHPERKDLYQDNNYKPFGVYIWEKKD